MLGWVRLGCDQTHSFDNPNWRREETHSCENSIEGKIEREKKKDTKNKRK